MINFLEIKNKIVSCGFYRMIFRTRLRRIIITSGITFLCGVAVSAVLIFATNKISLHNSVGGLETPNVPNFNIDDIAGIQEISEIPIVEQGQEFQFDDEMANGMGTGDNLDSAAAVLMEDEEKNSSNDLELCYYTYRVKKGDMIGFIADNYNVTQDTIISANDIHQSRLLQIDKVLKIPSMPGIVYTVRKDGETIESIAQKYEVSAEKCSTVNNILGSSKLQAGKTIFVPDAQLDWVTRQEINGDLFKKPIKNRYYLSSYYGWRSSPFSGKRSYHSGIDMACPQGTPIYAALAGKVTSVGFNNVYGNYVIITHHSGYKSLYGHMSSISAKQGQYVDTNSMIGRVGSTGLSTGPHLHFTVYKFGKTVNPAALWK